MRSTDMRVCPKCGAYYADGSSGFCLVDGTPLVNIDPNSEKWSEGARRLKEKDDGLRKQRRKLKWRRVLISTLLVATIVVCAAAFNRWTYVERVPRPTPVFKISGQVTEAGKPLGDVKITLYRERIEIDSKMTDAQGKYAFTELPGGASYIITPDPKIRFTEPSQTINSLRQDEPADFFVQLYKISGQVTEAGKPLGDVKITLYRERIEIDSKMTDAQGKYAFTELPGGVSYIITPDPRIRFTEPSHTINLTKDEAADFSVQLYKITGQVTQAGHPRVDVKITLYRGRQEIDSKMTDAQGKYAFTELPGGVSYIITPDPKIRFTEPSHTINLTKDEAADFSVQLYKITGQVTGEVTELNYGLVMGARQPLDGVKITLNKGTTQVASKTTDASGNYDFSELPAGDTYTVIAARDGMIFEPPSQVVNLTEDARRNFRASRTPPVTYTIRGRVKDTNGRIVQIRLDSEARPTFGKTDRDGNFAFPGLPAGFVYTITPVDAGMTFRPSSHSTGRLTRDVEFEFSGRFTGDGPGTPNPTQDLTPTPDRTRRREPERKRCP